MNVKIFWGITEARAQLLHKEQTAVDQCSVHYLNDLLVVKGD